jgi:hypothetical protein
MPRASVKTFGATVAHAKTIRNTCCTVHCPWQHYWLVACQWCHPGPSNHKRQQKKQCRHHDCHAYRVCIRSKSWRFMMCKQTKKMHAHWSPVGHALAGWACLLNSAYATQPGSKRLTTSPSRSAWICSTICRLFSILNVHVHMSLAYAYSAKACHTSATLE